MRIEFSDDGRDFVRRDWSDLAVADPAATVFHSPRYLKLYWEEFGAEAPLLLAFADQGGETVGAAAFELSGRTLRFLGGTEVTDYMGPVAAPGAEDAVAKELVASLVRLPTWDEADLRGLPEDSPWLGRLAEAAEGAGLALEEDLDAVAPCLVLPGSREAWLESLPGKLRHEIRRKARRLESEAGEIRIAFATPETLAADLGTFVAWHRASEGPKGKFMVAGMEIFFRRLGEAFLTDEVFLLAFAEAGGERMAGAIGFGWGDTTLLYNSAYDHRRRELAPGMVLVAELIGRAADAGKRRFDLLKGDIAYKYRFGAVRREVRRLTLRRRSD